MQKDIFAGLALICLLLMLYKVAKEREPPGPFDDYAPEHKPELPHLPEHKPELSRLPEYWPTSGSPSALLRALREIREEIRWECDDHPGLFKLLSPRCDRLKRREEFLLNRM
jgi:hypothetical protein